MMNVGLISVQMTIQELLSLSYHVMTAEVKGNRIPTVDVRPTFLSPKHTGDNISCNNLIDIVSRNSARNVSIYRIHFAKGNPKLSLFIRKSYYFPGRCYSEITFTI